MTEAPLATRFLNGLETAFQRQITYRLPPHLEQLTIIPSDDASILRRKDVKTLFQSRGEGKNDLPRAFFSEWVTSACISPPLTDKGYAVDLASPILEIGGETRKGVDLIVSTNTNEASIPILGINVKLQSMKPTQRTERQRFNPAICAPSINVSLGNWEIDTREQEATKIREWMRGLVIPKITQSGKIPYMHALRGYIFNRITVTLNSYAWKAEHYLLGEYEPSEQEKETNLFPDSAEDFTFFHKKIQLAQQLFKEIGEEI